MGELTRLLEVLRGMAGGYDIVMSGGRDGHYCRGVAAATRDGTSIFVNASGPTPEAVAATALLQLADGLASLKKT